jgi:hypothetical protein
VAERDGETEGLRLNGLVETGEGGEWPCESDCG